MLLTPSGITRLLDGLESAGYVEKGSCPTDARVTYAVVTEAGLAELDEATDTHLGGLEELFVRGSTRRFGLLADCSADSPATPRGSTAPEALERAILDSARSPLIRCLSPQ